MSANRVKGQTRRRAATARPRVVGGERGETCGVAGGGVVKDGGWWVVGGMVDLTLEPCRVKSSQVESSTVVKGSVTMPLVPWNNKKPKQSSPECEICVG